MIKVTKFSKRIAIILLIAVFSIAGIVACSADATDPSASESSVNPDPDKTGPVTPGDTNNSSNPEPTPVPEPDPEPTQPTFGEDTYYKVYTPFRGEDYPTVSYQDTNTLLQYWKEMMGRKDEELKGNSRRWYIRDGDNRAKVDDSSIRYGNHYYFFDKNFDLVYYRQGRGSLRIRELVGAVIVKYYRGKSAGTYTVAGLYENLIENAGQYGWKHFSKFMHAGYNPDNDKREVGDLELLLLNIGFNDQNFDRFGVDSYYNVWAKGLWRDNIHYFIGQSPDIVDNQDPKSYALNQKVNLTYNPGAHNFWFMTAEPEAWELEEHPDTGWVQR